MKFICTQQNFLEGVADAEKIISRNFTLPILQNILIQCETQTGFAEFAATDLETGLQVRIPAKVEEAGAIAVPAKLISGLARALPQENIVISSKNNTLSLECKNYKSNVKGEGAGEFPLIPTNKNEDGLQTTGSDFLNGLAGVIFSAASSELKPELTGVCVQFREDSLCFAATDSFRLCEKIVPLPEKGSYGKKIIIPKKSADAILRIFEGQGGNLLLFIQDNQLFVTTKEPGSSLAKIRFVSRLIDGDYPNYEQIIPSVFQTTGEVPRGEIVRHVKSASLFSQKINEVVLFLSRKKQQLEISSQDQEYGNYHSVIPCEIEGEDVRLVLNSGYLLDGIQNMSGPTVRIKANQPESPILISSAENDGLRYVLMPIKTQ